MKTHIIALLLAASTMFATAGSLDQPASQRWAIKGEVFQKVEAGLLVDAGEGRNSVNKTDRPTGIILIVGYPNADKMADGDRVTCNVHLVGTYEYGDVSGSTRTVRKYQFTGK